MIAISQVRPDKLGVTSGAAENQIVDEEGKGATGSRSMISIRVKHACGNVTLRLITSWMEKACLGGYTSIDDCRSCTRSTNRRGELPSLLLASEATGLKVKQMTDVGRGAPICATTRQTTWLMTQRGLAAEGMPMTCQNRHFILRSQLSKPIPRKLDRGTAQEEWAQSLAGEGARLFSCFRGSIDFLQRAGFLPVWAGHSPR